MWFNISPVIVFNIVKSYPSQISTFNSTNEFVINSNLAFYKISWPKKLLGPGVIEINLLGRCTWTSHLIPFSLSSNQTSPLAANIGVPNA